MFEIWYYKCIIERRSGVVSDCKMPSVKKGVMRYEHDGSAYFIPASNEPSVVLARAFGECREGQIPRSLSRGI